MKSAISFFNPGVSRNLLKRTWPVWTGYFLLLVLLLPVALSNTAGNYAEDALLSLRMEYALMDSAVALVYISFGVGVAAAMAVFSFLYQPRTCGMMCSMPLRRETLFGSCWLTGLLCLLCSDLAVLLITLAFWGRYLALPVLLKWLGITVMGNLAFYGFACFCAMLTGSLLILPLVYLVLNLAAFVFCGTVSTILGHTVFGYISGNAEQNFLSPLVFLMECLRVKTDFAVYADGVSRLASVSVEGLGYLLVLFLAGLVFSVLALLLFRKRRMETAQDTVALNCLKPIFRCCMAFGGAPVFTVLVMDFLGGSSLYFNPVLTVFLLFLGAFLGWFGAEMVIRKSVRVFRQGWKGFGIVCAVCLVFVLGIRFDVLGYEDRLPDLDEAEYVEILFDNVFKLEEPENLEAAAALQQRFVSHKAQHKRAGTRGYNCTFRWYDADGELLLLRSYTLDSSEAALLSPDSDIRAARDLRCCREAVLSMNTPDFPVTADTVIDAWVHNRNDGRELMLTPSQAAALYSECLLPDMEAGCIGGTCYLDDAMGIDSRTGIIITLYLCDRGSRYQGSDAEWAYLEFELLEESSLTRERIDKLLK